MMKVNQAAFDIGQFTERMAHGYFAHCAAIEVASDPRAKALFSTVLPGQMVPVAHVAKKDGTLHTYHFHHFLDQVRGNPEFAKTWLVGSLLAVGDALSKHRYFDHAPELELIYHLRNGVAHGNRFHFIQNGLVRLKNYPAHNKSAWVKGDARFEITAALQGQPVLFDFMGSGDVLDLLMSVGLYLVRIGNGDPLRP